MNRLVPSTKARQNEASSSSDPRRRIGTIDSTRARPSGSSAITGWTVTFTLPAGHVLTGSWNAAVTVSGQTVTARNLSYNGALGPNASTAFGFQASRPNGQTTVPSGYTCAN